MKYLPDITFCILFSIFSFLFFIFPNSYISAYSPPTLSFSTPVSQVKTGEKITINVEINSPERAINALSGVISFPEELVDVSSINIENSIIKLWVEDPRLYSGKISFEGVILNPGFQASKGLVFSITFKAEKAGTVFINFNEGAVLANDGRGTNVLAVLESTKFDIISAPISTNKPTIIKQVAKPPFIVLTSPMISAKIIAEKFISFLKTEKNDQKENNNEDGFIENMMTMFFLRELLIYILFFIVIVYFILRERRR